MDKSLTIRQLDESDAAALSGFITSQSPEYLRFFYAFDSDESALREILAAAEKDVYSGIFWRGDIIGVFFLRGWDEGYELPSIGVLVDNDYRGKSVLGLMVESAKMIVRLSGKKLIIAKSHPDNAGLKNLIAMGLRKVGVEESTGNTLWHMDV